MLQETYFPLVYLQNEIHLSLKWQGAAQTGTQVTNSQVCRGWAYDRSELNGLGGDSRALEGIFFLDFCHYISKSYQITQFVRKRTHNQPNKHLCLRIRSSSWGPLATEVL